MDYQKIINGARANGGAPSAGGLIEEISSFGADLSTLAVLQARLAACDLKEEVRRIRMPLVVTAVSAVLASAGLVVLLIGMAFWLSTSMQLSLAVAFLSTGGACLVVCGIITAACVRKVMNGQSAFLRSHEELERNLSWIRTTLAHSGR